MNKTKTPVFVYGTLKKGNYNNRWLGDAEYQGEAITKHPKFSLYNLGHYPGMKSNGRQKIHGQVFLINDEIHKHLRQLESYPSMYREEWIQVILNETEEIKTLTYLYNHKTDDSKIIESAKW